ncbi:hypothetical protein Tco_1328822 [Tanacetum coccineum]
MNNTLKTQLLKIEMKANETSSAYLTRAKEYSDALANIGEPTKFNSLHELHGIPVVHDCMRSQKLWLLYLGFQLQPLNQQSSQAFFASRPQNNRGRGSNNRRGRGSFHNQQSGGTKNQFSWASNQNTVYGTCNRCGIGHVPSQCPNRVPSTIKSRQQQPSTNFADFRSQSSSSWLPDTGSNSHVAQDISHFDNHEPYYGEDALHVGNGKGLPILHIGSTRFYSPSKTFSLSNILHVPQITQNLLSVQKLCHDNNVFFEFHSTLFAVKDTSTRITLLTGPSNNGLYSFCPPQIRQVPKVAFIAVRASSTIWHQRLTTRNLTFTDRFSDGRNSVAILPTMFCQISDGHHFPIDFRRISKE